MWLEKLFNSFYDFLGSVAIYTIVIGIIIIILKFLMKNLFPNFYLKAKYFEFKPIPIKEKVIDINSDEFKKKKERFLKTIQKEEEKRMFEEEKIIERKNKRHVFLNKLNLSVDKPIFTSPKYIFIVLEKSVGNSNDNDLIAWIIADIDFNIIKISNFIITKNTEINVQNDLKRGVSLVKVNFLLSPLFMQCDRIIWVDNNQLIEFKNLFEANYLDCSDFLNNKSLPLIDSIPVKFESEKNKLEILTLNVLDGDLQLNDFNGGLNFNIEQKLASIFHIFKNV